MVLSSQVRWAGEASSFLSVIYYYLYNPNSVQVQEETETNPANIINVLYKYMFLFHCISSQKIKVQFNALAGRLFSFLQ